MKEDVTYRANAKGGYGGGAATAAGHLGRLEDTVSVPTIVDEKGREEGGAGSFCVLVGGQRSWFKR